MNEIEVLEERVITLKRHIKYYEESDCLTDVYQQLVKECQAIENLLKERQSDKERIKELEKENKVLNDYRTSVKAGNIVKWNMCEWLLTKNKEKVKFNKENAETKIGKMCGIDVYLDESDKVKFIRSIIKTEYIPKSLIKEKIKKLKEEIDEVYIQFSESNKTDNKLHIKGIMLEGKIQVLEELLNGKM